MKRLKKGLLFFIMFSIYSCAWLPHKRKILIPETGYRINNQVLKTNGYYYCEETDRNYYYCVNKKFTLASNRIKSLFLYEDGYAYYDVGYRTTGFNNMPMEFDSAFVVTHNSFEEARKNYELELDKKKTGKDSKINKGVFFISGDSLILQIYNFDQNVYFDQFRGKIVNDSTFEIYSREFFGRYQPLKTSVQTVNEIFHFKEYPVKADSVNYIRDHKNRFGK